MATRTALGTPATAKASGTNIGIDSVALNTGDSLFVGLGFEGQTMPATCTWGARELSVARKRLNATDDFSGAIYHARSIRDTATRNLDADWAAALNARVMIAIKVDGVYRRDNAIGNIQGSSAAPTVGPTTEHTRFDDFMWGLLVSEGPSSDTAPTLAGGFTAGQRAGTTGGGPATNITVFEGYQFAASSPGLTLSGTGATARTWTNVLVAFEPIAKQAWDRFGSYIEVGDIVEYNGNARTVNALAFQRNIVDLVTDGWVSAVECEVLNT